jgi:lipoyl(octanoyl) transferase
MQEVCFSRPADYVFALQLQEHLVFLRQEEKILNTVLFLEHDPVITIGRKKPQLPPQSTLPILETNRGGEATYHGPGQLIIYPIVLLTKKDLHAYLRTLEKSLIQTLSFFDLHAHQKKNATGVWIENRKIASIGIAAKKWVTYHGISLNISNEMDSFFDFQPCGFDPQIMTRMKDWLKKPFSDLTFDQIRSIVQQQFMKHFQENFSYEDTCIPDLWT